MGKLDKLTAPGHLATPLLAVRGTAAVIGRQTVAIILVDEPRPALARHISPDPLKRHENPLFEVHEQQDVHERPQYAREPSLQCHRPKSNIAALRPTTAVLPRFRNRLQPLHELSGLTVIADL